MKSTTTKTALGTFLSRVLFAMLAFLSFCLVVSGILFLTKNPTGYLSLFALLAFLLSGAATGFAFGKKEKSLSSFLPIVAFAMILLLVSVIAKKDALPYTVPLNLCCYIAVGGLFFLLGSGAKQKSRKHHSPYGRK